MKIMTPVLRISIGLVCLTIAVLFTANFLTNPIASRDSDAFQQRKQFLENLAVQYSMLVQKGEMDTLRAAANSLVARNPGKILSIALRREDGTTLVATPEHAKYWVKPPGDQSTLAHPQVPIYNGKIRWGTLEVSFNEATSPSIERFYSDPLTRFVAVVIVFAFVAYLFYMGRTLRYLDPESVIPDRIKAAFDALSEGIVLLDSTERIVLANRVFSTKCAVSPEQSIVGKELSHFGWHATDPTSDFPWVKTQRDGEARLDIPMEFNTNGGAPLKLMINTSPIFDSKHGVRGVLVSFDDVTALDTANANLLHLVHQLESSQQQLNRKNEELLRLATRDSLTNCLNRRYFIEATEALFLNAQENKRALCCIMADIDHFKFFNDRYGHSVGDEVIKTVAAILQEGTRSDDLVCRYGGEEFCIVLPEVDVEETLAVAERLREAVEKSSECSLRTTQYIKITASFGVSTLAAGAESLGALIDQADSALYASKRAGRNRVTRFDTKRVAALAVG